MFEFYEFCGNGKDGRGGEQGKHSSHGSAGLPHIGGDRLVQPKLGRKFDGQRVHDPHIDGFGRHTKPQPATTQQQPPQCVVPHLVGGRRQRRQRRRRERSPSSLLRMFEARKSHVVDEGRRVGQCFVARIEKERQRRRSYWSEWRWWWWWWW